MDEVHLNTTICPRHRDLWGIRWRNNKKNCSCPDKWKQHEKNQKGDRGINMAQSRNLYIQTQIILPVGSRKYNCYDPRDVYAVITCPTILKKNHFFIVF